MKQLGRRIHRADLNSIPTHHDIKGRKQVLQGPASALLPLISRIHARHPDSGSFSASGHLAHHHLQKSGPQHGPSESNLRGAGVDLLPARLLVHSLAPQIYCLLLGIVIQPGSFPTTARADFFAR